MNNKPLRSEIHALINYCQLGQHKIAYEFANLFINKYPEHYLGWKVLGILHQQNGNLVDACIANQKFVEISPADADAHYNLGNSLKELGKPDEAEVSYKNALAINPYDADAYGNLGIILKELGKLEEAQASYEKAIIIKPNFFEAHYNLGNVYKELGKLEQSQACYKKAIAINSHFAEAFHGLGNLLIDLGKLEEAQASYEKAIIIKPNFFEAHYNLGNVYKELGKLEDAQVSYEKAIVIKPNYAEAYCNLGITLKELGKLEEAQASYEKAIVIKPIFAEPHYNLGNLFKELGKLEDAQVSYEKAIVIKPNYAEAYCNLGVTLKELGKLGEAQASYEKAIIIKPNYAEAYCNLGVTLKELGKLEEAQASYEKAIIIKPNLAEAYYNLGLLARDCGFWEKTLNCIIQAINLDPKSIKFKWAFVICQIPKIYPSVKDVEKAIDQFNMELNNLNEIISLENLNEFANAIGSIQPYYLAYQEKNNKNLLSRYGEICCRVMNNWQNLNLSSNLQFAIRSKSQCKIKIGIISSHIHYHSVWNSFLKGIVRKLDYQKFELHIFYLKNYIDEETILARSFANSFVFGERDLIYWSKKISDIRLDIAFYPEIGMHPRTTQLASMRLAPVQICSWGHPETSGLPTIDYYISSELLESKYSDKNYTEKLLKLPGLGCYFEPPSLDSQDINFQNMGINKSSCALLCLGEPNKFSPTYDWVLVDIAKRLPNCQLIFMKDLYKASDILRERLQHQFNAIGLSIDKHVVFLPPLSRKEFSTLMQQSIALLDTIGFSGFNTAMQAIGCGLPIITREGNYMRTRCASAILRTIGLNELVVNSEIDYINLVEKITLNQAYRMQIKSKIRANENLLYKNIHSIRALENFFEISTSHLRL